MIDVKPYHLIADREALEAMVNTYRSRPKLPVCFDTETTGFDSRHGKIITLQFKQFGHIPIIVDVRQWNSGAGYIAGKKTLAPLFDGTLLIVGANLKFDYQWMLNKFGIRFNRLYDVMLAEQLIHGLGVSEGRTRGISFSLKATAERRELMEVSKEERSWFIDLDKREDEWNALLPNAQLIYGAKDVDVLEPIFRQQHKELEALGLNRVAKIEFSCLPSLAEIENNGVLIDQKTWREIIAEREEESRRLTGKAIEIFGPAIVQSFAEKNDAKAEVFDAWEKDTKEYEVQCRADWDACKDDPLAPVLPYANWSAYKKVVMGKWREAHPRPDKPKAPPPINVNSSQQLMEAFRILGIPAQDTRSETLDELAKTHNELITLVELRRAEKIVNSFGESLLKFVDGVDGRIHPDYIQIGASTGRMSCSRPNWQQIPSRSDTGKRLRACVVAGQGNVLLTADLTNIEMYVTANVSECPILCGFFEQGKDIHTETARAMFNLDESHDVNAMAPGLECSYRAAGKTTNFLILYSGGAGTLSQRLRIPMDKARMFIERWNNLYVGVSDWRKEQGERVAREMKSVTLSGRMRFFDLDAEPAFPFSRKSDTEAVRMFYELKREWMSKRSEMIREGTNAVIQGTAADIIKVALGEFFLRTVNNNRNSIKIVAVVHDEIVVECPTEHAEFYAEQLADSMQYATDMFLTRVRVPRSKVAISAYWSK